MTITPAESDNFPILGEPLPVELANTLYTHASGVIDFLATTDLIASWFAHAPNASHLALPRRLTTHQADAVRQLRDAVHRLFDAYLANDRPVAGKDVAILNKYAAHASCRPRLEWDDDSGPRANAVYTGGTFDVLVANLAAESIGLLAGPDLSLVRRCAHPDCQMFYVQHHHKRRFCHESCAHRARQARYYLATATAARQQAGS